MLSVQAAISPFGEIDSQGVRLLSRSQQNMLRTSEWWDKVWTSMLTGESNSLSNQALYTFLLPFLLVLMLLFLARAGVDYFKGDFIQGFNRSVVPVLILSLFLLGYGIGAKAVARATRAIMNAGTDLLMGAQITEVKFKEAIEDQLFALEFRQDLARGAKYCRSLPAPTLKSQEGKEPIPGGTVAPLQARTEDSLSCMESLLANVQARKVAIKQECPYCTTAEQYAEQTEGTLKGQIRSLFALYVKAEAETNFGYQLAAEVDEAIKVEGPLIAQYWFVSGQEFMLYLAAYLAPIMILYASLPLPGQVGLPITYFTAFLVIALTRLVYVLLLGLGASFLSSNPPNDGAEYWAQFLGYFAPFMATAAVIGGVVAAVHAWSGALISTAAAGISLVSSGMGSAVSSLQQRDYRNR
jgi:hypothetical protein